MAKSVLSNFLTPSITTTNGIKGKIKQKIEDFIVAEIVNKNLILDPTKDDFELPGKIGLFLHFVLIKRNIDNIDAITWVSKIWKIPRNNFNFAGTKDKRAITGQRVSVWGAKEKYDKGLIKNIDLPKFRTSSLCLKMKEIRLGDLWGNRFHIVIRDIPHNIEETSDRVEKTFNEIKSLGGLLNSFGIQRFGRLRPITHLVGKELILGNFREAIRIYVGKTFSDEKEETKRARRIYWDEENAEESLKLFPNHLRTEIQMLNVLKKSSDYKQVLYKLPLHLRKLFVHAYQSYLFNKYLVERYHNRNFNLRESITGEIQKGNNVFAPILGFRSNLKGEVKDIYHSILQQENIEQEDFQKEFIKKTGGKGTYRTISFEPKKLKIDSINSDDYNSGKTKVKLEFSIQRGSYATEILRELMK